MTDALDGHAGTVSIGGRPLTNLRFADDIDGLAGSEEELRELLGRLEKASKGLWNGNQWRKDENHDEQYQRHDHCSPYSRKHSR